MAELPLWDCSWDNKQSSKSGLCAWAFKTEIAGAGEEPEARTAACLQAWASAEPEGATGDSKATL